MRFRLDYVISAKTQLACIDMYNGATGSVKEVLNMALKLQRHDTGVLVLVRRELH